MFITAITAISEYAFVWYSTNKHLKATETQLFTIQFSPFAVAALHGMLIALSWHH